MTESICSIPLSKPPLSAYQLASSDNLLAAWHLWGEILGEDDKNYHFALHIPSCGWHAYRWDTKYGHPARILPISTNTVWVLSYNRSNYVTSLRVGGDGEATIATSMEAHWLLYADEQNCIIRKADYEIACLCWQSDGRLETKANFDVPIMGYWAHLLPDGAIATGDNNAFVMLSASGKILYMNEDGRHYYYYPPFITYYDDDHLYYTADPRHGWHKISIVKMHRDRVGDEQCRVVFFTVLSGACYTAIQNKENVALYRFHENSPDSVRCVCEIRSALIYPGGIVAHNGMICLASAYPIPSDNFEHLIENTGFLAWDPIHNYFHADIPSLMGIPKRCIARMHRMQLPSGWRACLRAY